MKVGIINTVLLLLFAGCASNPAEREQQLGGLATTSALVIALPLIPFAETYHILNQTEKKLRKEKEYWESVFDPIYTERIKLIKERSPEYDAEIIFTKGTEVYFPSLLREIPQFNLGALYPGVEQLWSEDPDKKLNYERARSDELANHMWILMSDDPMHIKAKKEFKIIYFSRVYQNFIQLRLRYKERFNLTMYKLFNQP